MAHRIVFDLDDLAFHPEPRIALGEYDKVNAAVVSFGWSSEDRISCTSPERLYQVAELLMEAARDLEFAQTGQRRDDDLDSFPKEPAA